jgi:hypothetical protein
MELEIVIIIRKIGNGCTGRWLQSIILGYTESMKIGYLCRLPSVGSESIPYYEPEVFRLVSLYPAL